MSSQKPVPALSALCRMRCELCSGLADLKIVVQQTFDPFGENENDDLWRDWQDTGGEGG